MAIACICGGLFELMGLFILSIFPFIGTMWYNYRQKKRCACPCHPEHKECVTNFADAAGLTTPMCG